MREREKDDYYHYDYCRLEQSSPRRGGANIVESCFWAKLHRRNIWQNTSVLFGA